MQKRLKPNARIYFMPQNTEEHASVSFSIDMNT